MTLLRTTIFKHTIATTTVHIPTLHNLMNSLRWLFLPQAPTHGSTIYQPPLVDHTRELSNYELQSTSPCGAPQYNPHLYYHKITSLTSSNREGQSSEPIRTGHH